MDIIGQNGNDGLHYEEEEEDKSTSINSAKIQELENSKKKVIQNDSTTKRTAEELSKIDAEIQRLKDEDNTITY